MAGRPAAPAVQTVEHSVVAGVGAASATADIAAIGDTIADILEMDDTTEKREWFVTAKKEKGYQHCLCTVTHRVVWVPKHIVLFKRVLELAI